jgi:predicted MFS family arabinose efflux permease
VLRVLKISVYRRLLTAYTLNELALGVGSLALSFLVYHRTGSAIASMGFFLSSLVLPALIAPSFVARLDRRPPRKVLSALYLLEAVAYGALAWVADRFSLAPVLVLAFADGIIALTARALARTASVGVLQPVGLLPQGNAVMNAAFSVCFMLGPAIAGLIVVGPGVVAALEVNAVIFALMALTLATTRGLPDAADYGEPTRGRVRGAIAYAWSRPSLRALMLLNGIGLVFFTISIPVEVVFVQHTLHAGAGGYGAMLSAWGAGAVVGSAVYARWHGWPPRVLIALSAGALGAGFIVIGAAPSIVVATIGSALAGIGNGVLSVSVRTSLQEQTREGWMALIMGLQESIVQAAPGLGIILGGLLTALGGARSAFAVAGIGAFAISAASWVVLRPAIFQRSESLASS